jgi:hypothetical protein
MPLPPQVTVEDPIKSRHDLRTTRESIKSMLANGTPDWYRFPNDYKSFVQESFKAEKEASDQQVQRYKMEGQEELTNADARKVNPIGTRDFIKKLRDNGVRCFTVDNGMAGTVALWAATKESDEMVYVAYLQIPAMYEYSVLRLDRHGLPNGEDFRGWRTVLAQLIVKNVMSEAKAHDVFGRPTDGLVSRRYRQTLFDFRNKKGQYATDPLIATL